MLPLPSVAKAYSLVLQEERQQGLCLSQVTPENIACVVTGANPGNSRNGGQFLKSYNGGHAQSPDSRSGNRRPMCSHYNKYSHNKDKMVTRVGLMRDGLDHIESPSHSPVVLSVSAQTWHNRLGHPSPHSVHLPSLPLYKGICVVCPLAKRTRSSFSSSTS
ncbi:hypothetical protein NE237_033092 [Protea cynaroides]|uniref:Uncharacterized protein n=1 Tax=Protea cynaroides TaxID=273540 RepID=A0A9Q0R3Q3_9MAGN|nr:hypothetical protein NE237_033092 [Protea cynaroides]